MATIAEYLGVSEDKLANMGGDSSAVEVFKGTGISSAGSSGFVPAPQIGDEDKFLCGNGTWATIPGGGASFPIASAYNAGLMSVRRRQATLRRAFQDSADFTDAVITGVGGKFVPSVHSVSDFIFYKESNLPYFDNKLKLIMEGNSAHICFLSRVDKTDSSSDTAVFSYTSIAVNTATASQTIVKSATTIGTTYWYENMASKTDLNITHEFVEPQFTFTEDTVIIS